MKSDLTRISLALLSAVFVLACQDLGLGPVGPDGLVPQFAKGGKKGKPGGGGGGAATYTVTHSGDVTTIPSSVTGTGRKSTEVDIGDVFNKVTIVLDPDFLDLLPGIPDACFPGGQVMAEVGLRARRGGVVTGYYFFLAFGNDGETPVGYSLELEGTVTSGAAFAPGSGQSTTVTWDGGLLHTEGAVPASGACVGGGGGKHSAQKNVNISGSVTVVGD